MISLHHICSMLLKPSKSHVPGLFSGIWVRLDGELRFGILCHLMTGLLTITCSNADAERGFSILRKIHTDQRSILKVEVQLFLQ